MKYYFIWFTGNTNYKAIVENEQQLMSMIKKETSEQNEGEAKSDKIHYQRHFEVTEQQYLDSHAIILK